MPIIGDICLRLCLQGTRPKKVAYLHYASFLSQNDKHLAPSPTQCNCLLKVVAPDVAGFAAAIIP